MVILPHRRKAFRATGSEEAGGGGGGEPTFVAASTSTYAAHGNNALIIPSGVTDGNLLIAWTINQLWNPGWTVTPTGWTKIGTTYTWGDQYGAAVYYKIASSEPASYSVAGNGWSMACCLEYSGATSIDTAGSWTTTNNSGPVVTSAIYPSSGSKVLSLILFRQGFPATTISSPSGFTQRVNEAPSGNTAFLFGAADIIPSPDADANWAVGANFLWSVGANFLWSVGIQVAIT